MVEERGILPFIRFQPAQTERLQALAQTPEWTALLARRAALEEWKASVRAPPAAPSQLARANERLRQRNAERVRELLREGVTDEEVLLKALGDWEAALAGDDLFPIVFLGLVLTLDCSFLPRCLYCNQIWLPRRLRLEDWKTLLSEVAEPVPPYVYLTGGEPLILGAEVWGDEGLVAFATRLGCAVNINTNATLITPQIALQLVKVGAAKLHVSLDAPDARVQGGLFGAPERTDRALAGIFNMQIAREVLGVNHPQIHINCVLTSRNLFQFPDLLRFLLEIRQVRSAGHDGAITDDPLFGDFAFHLIPVGGSENALLRPTAGEWKRFYTETWAEAEQVWLDYQANVGVTPEARKSLAEHVPFASPFLRADHRMSLDEYCERAARGEYWQGALTERCYVAPTQAFVLPDGSQHWCGAHAIRRPPPLGNVTERTARDSIRSNISRLAECPNAFCAGCAGATCVINQATERNLKSQVAEWLREPDLSRGP
jgi:MoaA/NifB/PqqE/SkfB family radical SAM enzyme